VFEEVMFTNRTTAMISKRIVQGLMRVKGSLRG
jgi:hypothetical protein